MLIMGSPIAGMRRRVLIASLIGLVSTRKSKLNTNTQKDCLHNGLVTHCWHIT